MGKYIPKKDSPPSSPAIEDSSQPFVKVLNNCIIPEDFGPQEVAATAVLHLGNQSASLATLAVTGMASGSNTIDGMIKITDGTNDVWIPTMSTIVA